LYGGFLVDFFKLLTVKVFIVLTDDLFGEISSTKPMHTQPERGQRTI